MVMAFLFFHSKLFFMLLLHINSLSETSPKNARIGCFRGVTTSFRRVGTCTPWYHFGRFSFMLFVRVTLCFSMSSLAYVRRAMVFFFFHKSRLALARTIFQVFIFNVFFPVTHFLSNIFLHIYVYCGVFPWRNG